MKILRWSIVTIGAVIFATVSINAFDNIGNFENSLVGSIIFSGEEKGPCPEDMVYVADSEGAFCIDKFEASPSKECLYSDPKSKNQTDDNLAVAECISQSAKGVSAWRNIARHQAELACAKSGKRLPTNREWYRASLGTPDKSSNWGKDDCNVSTKGAETPDVTGSHELCKSVSGAYDMIGNVWEWVEETVYEGQYDDRPLPGSGYVTSISSDGMIIETDENNPDPAFFEDYFSVDNTDARGLFRGGYWNSESDAGQYAVNATVPPSFVGKAVGFRCVMEAN